VYFFQDAPFRALNWATKEARKIRARNPATPVHPVVFKVLLDLSDGIDFLDTEFSTTNKANIENWSSGRELRQLPFKENLIGIKSEKIGYHYDDNDFVKDIANWLPAHNKPKYIRAPFSEGSPLFSTSWIFDRGCSIICVLDQSIIKDMKIING
jgi:hypothetical protein